MKKPRPRAEASGSGSLDRTRQDSGTPAADVMEATAGDGGQGIGIHQAHAGPPGEAHRVTLSDGFMGLEKSRHKAAMKTLHRKGHPEAPAAGTASRCGALQPLSLSLSLLPGLPLLQPAAHTPRPLITGSESSNALALRFATDSTVPALIRGVSFSPIPCPPLTRKSRPALCQPPALSWGGPGC